MKERDFGEEQPYFSAGIFKIRLPFIHYRWEWPEVFQGLLLSATCLGAIPILTGEIGLSFELALTMVILNGLLYNLHALLGDPVVPGWITPAIPLVLGFLGDYTMGPERIKALIALQLLLGIFFIVMAATGFAGKLIRWIPDSVKGGILLGAGLAAVTGEIESGGRFMQFPMTIMVGGIISYYILFSSKYKAIKSRYDFLAILGKYGMVPGILAALFFGGIFGELPAPDIQWQIFVPQVDKVITEVSPFGIGFPGMDMFLAALPMMLVVYIIAFGDFITSKGLIEEADEERQDEDIDFNPDRSNYISGIRNIIQSVTIPYPTLCGPLWAAVTAAVSERYKEGRKHMDSFFGGVGTFRWATFIAVGIYPLVTFLEPVLPVALSLTLLVQGFVCTRIAMNYTITNEQKGIAGVMGAVLAVKGAAWGLGIGLLLHFLVGTGEEKIEKKEDEEMKISG
ncbi:MAG: hypothetical protein ACOCZR_02740 [Halanaerobiales bacterium]